MRAAWALLLVGCIAATPPASVSADIDGPTQESVAESTECADQATLTIDISRIEGNLTIRVTDGGGAVAFDDTYTTGGEFGKDGASAVGSEQRSLFGAAGTWTLSAQYQTTTLAFVAELEC